MIKTNVQERRDSVRIKRIVTVRHRLHKRDNKKREDIWQLATTEDMSYSGLLFNSVFPYETEDIVELQVVMSGVLYLFNGYGRVVRVLKNNKEYFQIAVKYVDLKSRHRDAKSLIASNRVKRSTKKSKPKSKSKAIQE
jgi:hypothetical protein